MDANGIVGNGRAGAADGSDQVNRLGRNGELVILQGGPDYWENLIRGNSFMASTGTAGVAPGTALSTTPPFVLYNPPNSGVIAAVCDAEMAYVSGTWGVGNVVLAGIGLQAIIPANLGTVLTPTQPNLIGGTSVPSCKALQAPTLSAAPTLMRNLWLTTAFVNTQIVFGLEAKKDLKGLVGVMPGGAICIQMVGGAGTTPLGMFTMSWVELPIVFNK